MRPARGLLFGFGALALVARSQECLEPPAVEYVLRLPASDDQNLTVPPLMPAGEAYSYAKDNALVAIPSACVAEFGADLFNASDLPNKEDCNPQGIKYLRIADLVGGYEKLTSMVSCATGLVIGFHGSGGPGWGQVQYAAMFSGMGYIHVIPDSMAMPDSHGLKGKTPLKKGNEITTTDYCGSYSSSYGSCSKFSKPYCYSSKSQNILNDEEKYRTYVEGVYQIRKREMDWFVSSTQDLLMAAWPKVYAVGNSEGAMVLSRYYNEKFHPKLSGIIIDGWSCEFNYFMSCANHSKICEDKCDKSTPLLNLIGDADEYFGREGDTMAKVVAADAKGYGASNITGNCHKTFTDQGFTEATTVVFLGVEHTPKYWNDNLVRDAVETFVGYCPVDWKSRNNCTSINGVFECPTMGAETCMPGWVANAAETTRCTASEACSSPSPTPTGSSPSPTPTGSSPTPTGSSPSPTGSSPSPTPTGSSPSPTGSSPAPGSSSDDVSGSWRGCGLSFVAFTIVVCLTPRMV